MSALSRNEVGICMFLTWDAPVALVSVGYSSAANLREKNMNIEVKHMQNTSLTPKQPRSRQKVPLSL